MQLQENVGKSDVMSIRVMLADDHKILREALRSVLEQESDIAVVAEASDGAETISLYTSPRLGC